MSRRALLAARSVQALQVLLHSLSRVFVSLHPAAQNVASATRQLLDARDPVSPSSSGAADDPSDWALAAEALGGGPSTTNFVYSTVRVRSVMTEARPLRQEAASSILQLEKLISKESRVLSNRRARDSVYAQLLFDLGSLVPGARDRWESAEEAWCTVDVDVEDFIRHTENELESGSALAGGGGGGQPAPSAGRRNGGRFGRFFSSRRSARIVTRQEIDVDAKKLDGVASTMSHLSGLVSQMADVLQLRQSLNTVYTEQIALSPSTTGSSSAASDSLEDSKNIEPDYPRILQSLRTLQGRTSGTLTHPDLSVVKEHLRFELEALHAAIDLQIQVSELQFVSAMLAVIRLKKLTADWQAFLDRLNPLHPAAGDQGSAEIDREEPITTAALSLVTWLFTLLLSKLGLYFHDVLLRKEISAGGDANSLRLVMSHVHVNFVQLIESFVARSDVANVSVVACLQDLGKPIESNGYTCRDKSSVEGDGWEAPAGRAGWPAIFSRPSEAPIRKHWPNVLSVVFRNAELLDSRRVPLYFYDSAVECTYCVLKIDPAIYLVLIFERRKDSDNLTKEFLTAVSATLRLVGPLSTL